jgi:hypothetical protein
MNNVVRLFDQKNFEIGFSESDRITTAGTNALAASAKLADAVKELSKSFNAIEQAIASIDDAETKSRFKQPIKRSQEASLRALIQMVQEIGKSVGCRGV